MEFKPSIPWREMWIARSLQIEQSKHILLSIPHLLSRTRLWNPLLDHSEMRQLAPTTVHTRSEVQSLGYASGPLSNSHSHCFYNCSAFPFAVLIQRWEHCGWSHIIESAIRPELGSFTIVNLDTSYCYKESSIPLIDQQFRIVAWLARRLPVKKKPP
jgi:hypothetical protein